MVSHKKGKKKSKKSQVSSLLDEVPEGMVHAEIVDEDSEYPTSRVIKRAPNGDVVVESLPEQKAGSHLTGEPTNSSVLADSQWPMKLDSHWDSLSLEERRNILRISKDELFDMIKSYKNVHSCDCSMCGRHNNITMEQEMEEIYNELYETAKEEDSDTDFFLFHLKLIKEYQSGNNKGHPKHHNSPRHALERDDDDDAHSLSNYEHKIPMENSSDGALQDSHTEFLHSLDESAVKFCLAEKEGSDSIGDTNNDHDGHKILLEESINSLEGKTSLNLKHEIEQFKHSKQKEASVNLQEHFGSNLDKSPTNDARAPTSEEDAKLVQFARTFVSSHPRIAEEFINKALMYPHIRALTEDVMRNKGEGLRKAMESWVLQQQDESGLNDDTVDTPSFKTLPTDIIDSSVPLDTNSRITDVLKALSEKKIVPPPGPSRLDALFSGVGSDFSKNISNVDNFKSLFNEMINDENRLKELSGNAEYMELERIRNEISAGEEAEDSYEWSDADFEDGYDDKNNESKIIDNDGFEDEVENTLSNYDAQDSPCRERDVEDNAIHFTEDGVDVRAHHSHHRHNHHHHNRESDIENDEGYNSEIDHAERLEEGRRLIQIAITKLLQKKLIASFKEKEAEKNRLKLLMELEAEENQKKEKEKKKQKKREKEKEKKRQQQQVKEEEKKKQQEEEVRLQKEAEERELARREAQRKKVEEARKKKDEERKRKLEEQRQREEEQARQRKIKEDQKRQREEEQRLKREEKEKKKLLLEEEKKKKIQLSIAREEEEKVKEIEQKIKAVPYGYSSLETIPHGSSINDDIFNMINQASQSLSGSPSRHGENIVAPPMMQSAPDGLNISTSSIYSHLTPLSVPDASPQTQPAVPSYSQGIIQAPLAWDDGQTSQNSFFNGNHVHDSHSMVKTQKYQTFNDSAIDIADEIDNITSFLNDTNLNDVHLPSETDPRTSSVDPMVTAPMPNSSTYNQSNLWPNESPQVNPYVPPPPVTNPLATQPRRSIWDSGADLPFAVGTAPMHEYNPHIWSNAPSTVSSGMTSNNMENEIESKIDILLKSYNLLAPDHSFVPLDKLYQASLTFMSAKTALTYSEFVSTLVSMKTSHNCELLNDNSGLLAYCRMGMSTSKPATISSYSPIPYQRAQQSSAQPVPSTNSQQNALFADTYQPASSNPLLHLPGANPQLPSDHSTYMNIGQSFPQQFQTSNIWD